VKLQEEFWDRLEIFDDIVHDLYQDMIRAGVARECARNILPLYTPTKIHIAGTIRSFIHFVGLRGQEDTQLEHRTIARSIGAELNSQIPIIIAAVKNSEDKSLKGWDFLDD
jgi:thymidylate synthase (FAD)